MRLIGFVFVFIMDAKAADTLLGVQAVYKILKTLQYIHRFHNTLCALRPLLHHISTVLNPCVCIVRMCVYACVCAYVCVASQSHKVFFNLFFII